MAENALVSVCIQTYQHGPYIRQCLESVLAQKTDFPFEIILGEDESDDGTREICEEFAKRNPVIIKLFKRKRGDVIHINGKPTGRYNMLANLKEAQGKYVALLEGDDYWIDPYKLQKQVDILEKRQDIVACHTWHRIAEKQGDHFILKEAPKKGHGYLASTTASVREIFLNHLRLKSRTLVFRKNAFHETEWLRTKVSYGDVPLTMILGKSGDFAFIDEETAVYRQTGEGVSSRYNDSLGTMRHFINWIQIWELGNNFHGHHYWKEARLTIIRFNHHILREYKYRPSVLRKLLFRSLFKSELPWPKRSQVFARIVKVYLKRNLDLS